MSEEEFIKVLQEEIERLNNIIKSFEDKEMVVGEKYE